MQSGDLIKYLHSYLSLTIRPSLCDLIATIHTHFYLKCSSFSVDL